MPSLNFVPAERLAMTIPARCCCRRSIVLGPSTTRKRAMSSSVTRNYAIGKLYTRSFYRLVRRHLAETGALVVQSTSPYAAPRAFWCIERTLADAEYTTYPYHAYVPSFGDWGFVLALPRERPRPRALTPGLEGLRYLDTGTLNALFAFPADQRRPEGLEINRLGDQAVVGYHEQDWRKVD